MPAGRGGTLGLGPIDVQRSSPCTADAGLQRQRLCWYLDRVCNLPKPRDVPMLSHNFSVSSKIEVVVKAVCNKHSALRSFWRNVQVQEDAVFPSTRTKNDYFILSDKHSSAL